MCLFILIILEFYVIICSFSAEAFIPKASLAPDQLQKIEGMCLFSNLIKSQQITGNMA